MPCYIQLISSDSILQKSFTKTCILSSCSFIFSFHESFHHILYGSCSPNFCKNEFFSISKSLSILNDRTKLNMPFYDDKLLFYHKRSNLLWHDTKMACFTQVQISNNVSTCALKLFSSCKLTPIK